jgi:hypothetical protein
MSDRQTEEGRNSVEELADLKRRIKATRNALQSVRRKPKAIDSQGET